MTDREMLEKCIRAMEESMRAGERGVPTDWTAMINSLRKHTAEERVHIYPHPGCMAPDGGDGPCDGYMALHRFSESQEHELERLRANAKQASYPCSPHCAGYLRELALRNTFASPHGLMGLKKAFRAGQRMVIGLMVSEPETYAKTPVTDIDKVLEAFWQGATISIAAELEAVGNPESAVDWSVVRDAIGDTFGPDGMGSPKALEQTFEAYGLFVIQRELTAAVPTTAPVRPVN